MAAEAFSIEYHHPYEPIDGQAVAAATIMYAGRTYSVQVYQSDGAWWVAGTDAGAAIGHPTFQAALAAAHRDAYHYGASLAARQQRFMGLFS